MLHLWSKPAYLLIDAEQVKGYVYDKATAEAACAICQPQDGTPHSDCVAAAVIDALSKLSALRARSFQTVNVIIGDDLIFYEVLAMDARTLSDSDVSRVAALALADILGLDAKDLLLRCCVQKGGLSVVICGVAVTLVTAIRQAIETTGHRLNRLDPEFANFLDSRASLRSQPTAIVARLRDYSLALGLRRAGLWQAFAIERLSRRVWDNVWDSCDAFCSRCGIPEEQRFPVFFEADLEEMSDDKSAIWKPLGVSPRMS